jgi:hypothetical protein
MMTSFERLLAGLADADVRFVTVGGVACAMNGHVRATEDVDILVDAAPDNLVRMLDFLASVGDGYARELTVDDFPLEPGAVRLVEDYPIDIFTLMDGQTFDELAPHIRWWSGGASRIPYLDARALADVKSSSLRPKDQEDVRVLRALLPDR